MTIKKQLWLLCAGFLFVLTTVSIFSYQNSTSLMADFDNVADVQLPAVRNMTLADMMHDGLRSVVLASLVAAESNDKEELKSIVEETKEKSAEFQKYLGALEKLPLNDGTMKAISETKPEMEKYIAQTKRIVEVANAEGWLVTETLVKKMTQFASRIEAAGDSLSGASGKLNQASQSLASGATESAASLEETVASLEELSSMVKLNSESAQKASTLSKDTLENSRRGAESVRKLTISMDSLKDSSKKMEEIIQVIDDIAFQTNLLALNASVEAARAGEPRAGPRYFTDQSGHEQCGSVFTAQCASGARSGQQ